MHLPISVPPTSASPSRNLYPSKQDWLLFFDKALLTMGVVAIALSVVLFVAYNWFDMGKTGKFVLVEGALILNILAYSVLVYKQRAPFVQQLFLFTASILTGVLLALVAQVYQTGIDRWQLFLTWAALITPFALLSRMPALWLLWLGLINLAFDHRNLFNISIMINRSSWADFLYILSIFLINFLVFNIWLYAIEHKSNGFKAGKLINPPQKSRINFLNRQGLHWSTYVVGALVALSATRLALIHTHDYYNESTKGALGIMVWLGWAGFVYLRHRVYKIDLLMLTYLCISTILIMVISMIDYIYNHGGYELLLLLALMVIGFSGASVTWLRRLAKAQAKATPQHLNSLLNTNTITVADGDIDDSIDDDIDSNDEDNQ